MSSHRKDLIVLFLIIFISCSLDVNQNNMANNLSSFDEFKVKECVFGRDCPQPRCIGAVSVCQNSSCVVVGECVKESSFDYSCNDNLDCYTTGCSNELCVAKNTSKVITLCEFKPEFDCLKHSSCQCANNKCSWKETYKYRECMRAFK